MVKEIEAEGEGEGDKGKGEGILVPEGQRTASEKKKRQKWHIGKRQFIKMRCFILIGHDN